MKKLAVPDQKICVSCGACIKVCRKGAVSVYKGCYAQIDESRCVGCGLCARACPAGCIAMVERSGGK